MQNIFQAANQLPTRSLGLVGADGEPQIAGSNTGDAGLSSLLAKLQSDWGVAKGRLGINNPDQYGTLFSLRRELFNLPYKEDGTAETHIAWQDKLRFHLVRDLRSDPAIAAHALPASNPPGLAQPGFVISFPTNIETGLNFFGRELGAGDSAFSSASFSTRINSVGVAFQGYLGMNPYANGSTGVPGAPTHNSPDALAATSYVYFIPGGADSMRTPPLNGAPATIRNWLVLDHAMPLPFDIGSSGFGQKTSSTGSTSLSEPYFLPRKHQPFRAVSDPTLFYSTIPAEFTNRRLIGRSVWNTRWKLVIPAQTLPADPGDGIERFIRSVKDIGLFMCTYSHAGNCSVELLPPWPRLPAGAPHHLHGHPMKKSLTASAVFAVTMVGAYLLVTYSQPVAAPESAAVAGTVTPAKELLSEEVWLRINDDAANIFRRAFWREPTPDDHIRHAECREWVSKENGVRRWQWFLAFEPSAAFSAWLRGGNSFSLAREDAAQFHLASSAPAWFPSGPFTARWEIHHSPDQGMTLLLDTKTRVLYATDTGHGFAGSSAPQLVTHPVPPGSDGSSTVEGAPPR